jgi:ubiquinone/menaquinone biosynthesis C-methylase UbiE
MTFPSDVSLQQDYYAKTAHRYDVMHVQDDDEHFFALAVMVGLLDYLKVQSILDIGSGTGRAISYIKQQRPDIRIVGVEPVAELRNVAYQNGLSPADIVEGDATQLSFADGEFDLVCEFGVLHHIRCPEKAIEEMMRVSKIGVFISDVNNFGSGSQIGRFLKQSINFLGLWKAFDLFKTRGKGYIITEGDGLSYSYSVFNNYKQIRKVCRNIHVMNTRNANMSHYKTSSHVALLGLK